MMKEDLLDGVTSVNTIKKVFLFGIKNSFRIRKKKVIKDLFLTSLKFIIAKILKQGYNSDENDCKKGEINDETIYRCRYWWNKSSSSDY